jgi:predicted Zn-dependent protease
MGAEAAKQYGGVGGSVVALFEGSIDDVFKTIVVNGYSRSAEEAADAQAVVTLNKAGYDSGALAVLLTKMMARERGGATGIFKTHPPTGERLARLQAGGGKEAAPSPAEIKRTERFKKAGKG